MWSPLQIPIILELSFYVLAKSNIIVERWVNASDVITSFPFTTMTSCYMGCWQKKHCVTIGFNMDPEKVKNAHCSLLKTKGVGKREQNFMPMFLVLHADDVEEEIKQTRLNGTNNEKETETCKPGGLWKRINLINNEQPISKNNLVTTLEKVTKQYVMHLEVKITPAKSGAFYNIVHFTKDGNSANYGDRTPSVFFVANTRKYLISSSISNNKKHDFYTNEVTLSILNKWTSIQVSQLKQKSGYNYSITINGKLKYSVINTSPGLFENVKVFASSPFTPSQSGSLREFWMDIYQGEE